VVVAVGSDGVTAVDAERGVTLWRQRMKECDYFTGPGIVGCDSVSTVDVVDAATGKPVFWPQAAAIARPIGCAVGHSGCTGLAVFGSAGWLIQPGGGLTRAAGLTDPDGWLVGKTLVRNESDRVLALDAVSGKQLWSWPLPASGTRAIAVEPDRVHVLTPLHDLVTLDLATGSVRGAVYAHVPSTAERPWTAGYVYASHGYVAIERLLPNGSPKSADGEYYFPVPTLIYAGS
jgi:hypothetical protein